MNITPTPWDSRVLGIPTFEVNNYSDETIEQALNVVGPGHYTLRVDPLVSKQKIEELGFYYCDTLIEVYCHKEEIVEFDHKSVDIVANCSSESVAGICKNTFIYDRFHRDYNITHELADARYLFWLEDLYSDGYILGLTFNTEIAGFFACQDNRVLLHALSKKYRGKKLSKFFWSAAYRKIFSEGHSEVESCISIANSPVLNLYASLGFSFRNPKDIYHLYIP